MEWIYDMYGLKHCYYAVITMLLHSYNHALCAHAERKQWNR